MAKVRDGGSFAEAGDNLWTISDRSGGDVFLIEVADIIYTSHAIAELRELAPKNRDLLLAKIKLLPDFFAQNSNNIRRLKNIDAFRLRVGNYRVIFSVHEDIFEIRLVRTRNEKTYKKIA